MEKQKTPLAKLIETLTNFKQELDEKYDGDPLVKRGIVIAIAEAQKLLPEERKMVEDAYDEADRNAVGKSHGHGKRHFDETYEQ